MTVFKYIEDKDVFQKFYSRMLAKRLVHTASASDDAETSMISKLKEACGFEYTNKLQRMFQDIQISKDLNASYRTFVGKTLGDEDLRTQVDTNYSVLGTGFWPLNPGNSTFYPPEVIVKTYEHFEKFYLEKHSGRKLTWLWNLSKGEMKANYVRNGKNPYIFQVSTYQMAILMLFNDADTVSYDDLARATGAPKEQLDPSIGILVKSRVLLADGGAEHKIGPGTVLNLNYNFRSKKMRVNLNIAVKSEQKAEVEDTHKNIEEDRKVLMQVCILFHLPLVLLACQTSI
jgi:cullin 1